MENLTIELVQSQYDRGREDARRDAAQGNRKIYVPTRGGWGRFLFVLMRDRYGVFVEHVSDMTTSETMSYERGYNSIALEYIDNTDGAGAMDKVWAAVDAFRTELYNKHFGNSLPTELK